MIQIVSRGKYRDTYRIVTQVYRCTPIYFQHLLQNFWPNLDRTNGMHAPCDKDIDSCINWGLGPPQGGKHVNNSYFRYILWFWPNLYLWPLGLGVKIGVWTLLESLKGAKSGKIVKLEKNLFLSNLKQFQLLEFSIHMCCLNWGH